jgi:hypothetical protein
MTERATQQEVEMLMFFALSWGWEEFVFHVGHLLAVHGDNGTGDRRDALQSGSEIIHARLALWRRCGDDSTLQPGPTP